MRKVHADDKQVIRVEQSVIYHDNDIRIPDRHTYQFRSVSDSKYFAPRNSPVPEQNCTKSRNGLIVRHYEYIFIVSLKKKDLFSKAKVIFFFRFWGRIISFFFAGGKKMYTFVT
jgi:hypothetical protein